MMTRWGKVAAAVMVLAACSVALGDASPWETIEWGRMDAAQRFKWALDLFRMGRSADSAEVLTRVISTSPDARTVVGLQDMLDPTWRTAMLADVKTTKAVQGWVRLYESSIVKLRRDDAYIAETVGGLTGDGSAREFAIKRLEQLSEFAVPHVIRLMDQTQNTEHRATCRKMLLRLGHAAALPTIEYLESSDDSLRVQLLGVLGALKDVRAQAAVCRIAVDRRANREVRRAAMNALSSILYQPRPGIALSRTPTVNYWRLADAWLHEKPFAMSIMEGNELPVWKWSAEKNWVTYRMVPRRLYNEELAEEACYDGLSIDKDDRPLRAMVIAVYFSQKLELLGADDAEVNRALEMAILVGGKHALKRCMAKALADGNLGIAVQAAQTLGEVGAGKGFTALEQVEMANPLLAALNHEDRGVRFAAARAIARCQPRGPGLQAVADVPAAGPGLRARRPGQFDNYWQVLPALSWGLMYELPSRTVLIIHPDPGTINHYKGELRKLGHHVADTTDVSSGMRLAAALPRPDVVFLSADFRGALNGLRAMLGSRRIPVVLLMSAEQKKGMEYARGIASGVLVDRAGMKNIKLVLKKALNVPEKRLVKDLIPGISARAAEALAGIVPQATPLPMKSVAGSLRRVLTSTDDAVRIPALRALGHVAADEAALDVLAVAADKRARKPVRLAALDALAKILQAQRQVPPDVFADLVPLSSESDAQISLAAARAIAVAKFDPGQFADLLVLKRVQEITSGVRP